MTGSDVAEALSSWFMNTIRLPLGPAVAPSPSGIPTIW